MVVGTISHDRITSRLTAVLLGLMLAAVVVVAVGLARYAFPRADELSRAGRARKIGIPASMRKEYRTSAGRWAGTGIAYALGKMVNEERWYGALLVGIAAVLPLAVYALLGVLVGSEFSR